MSENVWGILACSYCKSELHRTDTGASCDNCGSNYIFNHFGSLDLHPQRTQRYSLDFEVGAPLLEDESQFEPLRANLHPEVDFGNFKPPRHLTRELMSYFPRAQTDTSLMLDLGCGSGIHREVCERAGFEWVGLDYSASEADLLGDAHVLPFKDNSFEFILCITVLQYMRYPFIMMREVFRVLKPGGKLIGTVAFLEPFNGVGFYHNTHLGILNLLQYGGFHIDKLAPSEKWSALTALASMGLFPRMPRPIAQSMVIPVELLHKLWWRTGDLLTRRNRENMRIRNFTGSFAFIASKEISA